MFKVLSAISLDVRVFLSIYYVPGPGDTAATKGHDLCFLGGTDYRKQEALSWGLCVFVPRLVPGPALRAWGTEQNSGAAHCTCFS